MKTLSLTLLLASVAARTEGAAPDVDLKQWEACLFKLNRLTRPRPQIPHEWKNLTDAGGHGGAEDAPVGIASMETNPDGSPKNVIFLRDGKVWRYPIPDEQLKKISAASTETYLTLLQPGSGGFVAGFHFTPANGAEPGTWGQGGLSAIWDHNKFGLAGLAKPFQDLLAKGYKNWTAEDYKSLGDNLKDLTTHKALAKDALDDIKDVLPKTALVLPQPARPEDYRLLFAQRVLQGMERVGLSAPQFQAMVTESCTKEVIAAAQEIVHPGEAAPSSGTSNPRPGTQPAGTMNEAPVGPSH